MQNVTFRIFSSNDHLFTTGYPRISFDGTIDFVLNGTSAGTAELNISLLDNEGGESHQVVKVSVLVGQLEAAFMIANVSLLNASQIRQFVAAAVEIDVSRVIIGSTASGTMSSRLTRQPPFAVVAAMSFSMFLR